MANAQLTQRGLTCLGADECLGHAEEAWGLHSGQEFHLFGGHVFGDKGQVSDVSLTNLTSAALEKLTLPLEGTWLVAVEHGEHPWAAIKHSPLMATEDIIFDWCELNLQGAGNLKLARPTYSGQMFDLIWPTLSSGSQQARLDELTGQLLTTPFLPAKGNVGFFERPAFRYGVLKSGLMQWLDLRSEVAPEPITPATSLLRTRLALLGRELEARSVHFEDDMGESEPRFVYEDAGCDPCDFYDPQASVVRTVSRWEDHENKKARANAIYDPEDQSLLGGCETRMGYRALSSEVDVTEVELFGFPWEVRNQTVTPVWLADVIERSAAAAGISAYVEERISGQVDGTVQLADHDMALLKDNREIAVSDLWNAVDPADRIQRIVYLLITDRAGLEHRLSAARDGIVATVLAAHNPRTSVRNGRQPGPFPERCAAVMGLVELLADGAEIELVLRDALADIVDIDERRLALFWAAQLGVDLVALPANAVGWINASDFEKAQSWVQAEVMPVVGSVEPGVTPPPNPLRPSFHDMVTHDDPAMIPIFNLLPYAETGTFLAAWHAADISDRRSAGAMLLRRAVATEQFDVAEALIAEGISLGVLEATAHGRLAMPSSAVNETALSAAIEAGSVAAVRFCLERGADIKIARMEAGTTAEGEVKEAPTSAVVIAARSGQVELLKLFLELGGDPTSPIANGITPIIAAAYGGNVACLEVLVKAGANPCQSPAPHIFVDGPLTLTPLLYACERSHDDAILFLLAHGADPNVERSDGEWALQLAMQECRRETIEALIDFGADPFAINRDGMDILHAAALRRRADIIPTLLKAGVDPSRNAEIETGMTALMTAAVQGDNVVVELLLQAGADPFRRSTDGFTAIDLARKAADPDSFEDPFDKTIAQLAATMRRSAEVSAS